MKQRSKNLKKIRREFGEKYTNLFSFLLVSHNKVTQYLPLYDPNFSLFFNQFIKVKTVITQEVYVFI